MLPYAFKGTVSRDFLLQVFSWIIFGQVPENHIRVISNFFKNSRRYSQVNVHHRYQWHRWQICHRCHRYQQHRRQILPLVPLVLLIPVANLPPLSTIPVANLPPGVDDTGGQLPPVSTTPAANCHQCLRHRCQIMGTLSDCWHLKVILQKNSTTQRSPNKIIKFSDKIFFYLPTVLTTPVVQLELWISKEIFNKIWKGKLIQKKTWSRKSRGTVPVSKL